MEFIYAGNRYVNQIADRTGNTYLTDNCVPPHMTISAIEAKSVDVLIPAFKELKGRIKKGRIQLPAIVMASSCNNGQEA